MLNILWACLRMMPMIEIGTNDFNDFLEFVESFYQGYIESCRNQGKEPIDYERYRDSRFFWLVDRYKEYRGLRH